MSDLVISPAVSFDGEAFFLNGTKYIVPSLSLRQFKASYEVLTAPIPEGETVAQQAERFLPIILLALQRNYPEVTLDNLLDWVDLKNFSDLYLAVQGVSGLKTALPGE